MKIPVLLPLIALTFLSRGFHIPTESSIKIIETSKYPNPPCPCFPDFAGEDKVICLSTPAQSVVIGCNDGGSTDCGDLCYEWAPALGLAVGDRKKKNPNVAPTQTTEYFVTVSNMTGDNLGTTSMKIFVVNMEIVLYKPKVITTNTTTIADPLLGAQTFVNFDNDDNDLYYDNDLSESIGHGVIGGDDELVRAELKLTPHDLPDRIVRLIATSGAANIKIWKDEAKIASSEYILNTDIELVDRGAYLGADLWIEGVLPHTIQRGTKLSMTYKGGTPCPVNANLTIIGIDKISWEGINNNSVNDSNVLDADPNYIAPTPAPATWPSAVRIFPDARLPDNFTAKPSAKLIGSS